ncbi:hypothetical protein [Vagococcus elongatus]
MVVFSFKELSPQSVILFNELLDVFYDAFDDDLINLSDIPKDFSLLAEKNEQVKEAYLTFKASLA